MSSPEIFDGSNWQQIAYVQAVMQGVVSNSYTSELTKGHHIKFDRVSFQKNATNSIILDNSSSYTSDINMDSLGRIILKPEKTYKLIGVFNNKIGAHQSIITQWHDVDTDTPIGISSSMITVGFITPSKQTRVELRIINNSISKIPGENNQDGGFWFCCEEIG